MALMPNDTLFEFENTTVPLWAEMALADTPTP